MLFSIFSSAFDFLCVANIIFLRGGLAKFARACNFEGTLPEINFLLKPLPSPKSPF